VLDGLDVRLLNLNPLVMTADGFASPEECAAAIRAAEGNLERARVLDGNFVSTVSELRTNRHAAIDHRKDGTLWGLCLKLGVLLRLPFGHAEPLNVLNYQPGEEFQPHSDGHDPYSPGAEAEIPRGGQRLFTAIIYLNDVAGGGGTAFPELRLEVAPRRGRLLLFANTWAGSRELCALSVHAGLPVTEGEKWAATFWWRENSYDYSIMEG
jgi:prolyl 4-hydroxylase